MAIRIAVRSDLTALAKILAGGLPGGAVAGRAELMKLLSFKDDPHDNRFRRIMHTGAFNASPLSAAAGAAAWKLPPAASRRNARAN